MITYEYECRDCEYGFEIMQKHDDEPLVKCPECGKNELFKVISGGAYAFVYGEPTTVGHLAERNSKHFGNSQVESLEQKHKERGIEAKKRVFEEMKASGKVPQGAKMPEKKAEPWYGKMDPSKKKEIQDNPTEEKIKKYVMEGK
jgi:putative FmdB family regulatory protein